jgi:hypothetical protein
MKLLRKCLKKNKDLSELEQTIQQNQKYTQDLFQVALKEAIEPQN